MPRNRKARRIQLGLASVTAAIAGCAAFNPYRELPEPPTPTVEDNLQLGGHAAEALAQADAVRHGYYRDLADSARFRNITGVGIIGLTGWAIYNSLKFAGSTDGPTAGDTRRSATLGATVASLYALRQFLVNPDQESAYVEGYRAVTCLMLQSAPLLMTEAAATTPNPVVVPPQATQSGLMANATPAAGSASASMTRNANVPAVQQPTSGLPQYARSAELPERLTRNSLPPTYDRLPRGDLDRLRLALDELELQIWRVNEQVAFVQTTIRSISGSKDDPQFKYLYDQIKASVAALRLARAALSDGRVLVGTVEASGESIRQRTSMVVWAVNKQVQAKQIDIGKFSDVLKDASDITSSVLNIGVQTAGDELEANSSPETQTLNIRVPQSPGTANAAADLWTALVAAQVAAAAPVNPGAKDREATATPAGATPPSASASTPAAKQKKPKTSPPKAKTTPTAVGDTDETKVLADLKRIQADLEAAIKNSTARSEAAAKKKQQEALEALKAQYEKTLAGFRNNAAKDLLKCSPRPEDPASCGLDLARQTENLYAARRPVVNALLTFRAKTRATLATPECAELAALRVAPTDVVFATPGDTVQYILTQRAASAPIAALQGPGTDRNGAKFTLEAVEGTSSYKAKVVLGAQMPKQTLHLIVSNSDVTATRNLMIVVGDRRNPLTQPVEPASAPKEAFRADK